MTARIRYKRYAHGLKYRDVLGFLMPSFHLWYFFFYIMAGHEYHSRGGGTPRKKHMNGKWVFVLTYHKGMSFFYNLFLFVIVRVVERYYKLRFCLLPITILLIHYNFLHRT